MKQSIIAILTLFIVLGITLKNNEKQPGQVSLKFIPREDLVKGANDEAKEDDNLVASSEPKETVVEVPDIPIQNKKKVQISFPDRKTKAINMAREEADKFGVDQELLLCVLQDESGVESHDPKTGVLKCGDNGASCGIGQIKIGTWKLIRRQAGWDTEDQRENDYENIRTTAFGIANGWATHWTGYRKCKVAGY